MGKYVVKSGGGTSDTDVMITIGQYMEIAPIEEIITNGKFLDWTLIPDITYTPNDIYQNGEVWNTTPVERISVVDLSTPVTIGTFTSNSAVKIYGAGNNNITYGWKFTINVPENNAKKYQLYIGVSAEGNTYDLAYVEINGTQLGSYTTSSGTLTNYNIPLALPAGDNVITVKYKKDGSTSTGDDCVYIYGLEVKEFISEQK